MTNWKTIDELRQIYIETYTNSKLTTGLEKACNEEYELKMGYNGRQILELLQNVDDVYNHTEKKNDECSSVKISYKNNILEVGNTGTVFSAESIERLCTGGSSEKSSNDMGNKGTGFRSLLNDAEWIEVHSGDFHIRFSESYTKSLFQQYINHPLIKSQYDKWKKDYDLCFPILNCPEEIDAIDSEFDTLIRVKVKEENNEKDTSISKQLYLDFYKALLFLPNIRKIEVETDHEQRIYEKVCEHDKIILKESDKVLNSFYVQKKTIPISDSEDTQLVIAVPLEMDYNFSGEKVYCYFPIRNFNTPVHALIHARFLTNSSRDDIPIDEKQINKKLLKESLVFLKEIAEEIATKKIADIDLPITMLTPTNNFNSKVWAEDVFNLQGFYKDLLENARLLPTVNGELISFQDKPKYINKDFPAEFKGQAFANLLIKLKDEVYSFIEKLANQCGYYSYNLAYKQHLTDLKECINAISDDFDTATAVKIFLWWSAYCKECTAINIVPNLLKDTRGKWIHGDSKVYLPSDMGVSALPASLQWVNLCILHSDYFDELLIQIQQNNLSEWNGIKQGFVEATVDRRLLDAYSDKYLVIKLTDQSAKSTIGFIIEEINKQVDTVDKAVEFLNWFFENYRNKLMVEEDPTLIKIDYKLVDRNNKLIGSRFSYFGNEYGKSLSEKIFAGSSCSALAPLSIIYKGAKDCEEEFVPFLIKCGVSVYPKVYDRDMALNSSFNGYIQDKKQCTNQIKYLQVKTIDNFETILNKLSTKEIVQWFSEDTDFKNTMLLGGVGYFAFRINGTKYSIDDREYIRHVLNRTQWIDIGKKRYSPNQIVKYSKLADKINGMYGISESALVELLNHDIVHDYQLDFVSSLAALSDNDIHRLLVELPDVDNGEITRTLYEDIIRLKKGETPSYNVSDIKVLCLDGEYRLNTDVRYAARKIQRKFVDKKRLVDIQPSRNTETIVNWLGVDRYKMNLEVVDYSGHSDRKDFEDEIRELKIAILASLGETNNFTSKMKRLTIVPCAHILTQDVENNNQQFDIDDFAYIKHNGDYLLKLPNEYNKQTLRQSVEFGVSLFDIIVDSVSPQVDKNLVRLLVSASTENRKLIIEDQFGRDEWDYVNEALYQYKAFNDTLVNYFRDNGLDESIIEEIQYIDFSKRLSQSDFNKLRNVCVTIGKDISDINNISNHINIDVRENIAEEFLAYKESNISNFKMAIYNYLSENSAKQKDYLKWYDKFRCYTVDVAAIENSINVNVEALFNDVLKKVFDNIDITNTVEVDADKIYNQNYASFVEMYDIDEKVFDFFLDKNQDVKSMLYFGVIDGLKEKFDEFAQLQNDDEQNRLQQKENLGQTSTIETRLVTRATHKSDDIKIKSEHSQGQYDKQADLNEKAGNSAEGVAYRELKKSYPKLIWHSKNSTEKADKNNAPPNVTCDMWNIDESGKKTYFEIKSATNEFEMSINEYNSMMANPNDYEVVLVDIKKGVISRHLFSELEPLKQVSKYYFAFKQIKK